MMKKLFDRKTVSRIDVNVSDKVLLPTESTRTLTPEGYLKATAAVTKVGVQEYSAREFGIDSDEMIGVFRPPETVFHPETAESLKLKGIVFIHPETDVDATNHTRLAVGTVGETVEPIDSERLGASIQINDAEIVRMVLEREVEELSLGYDTFVVSEEGVFNGKKYHYKIDGPMIINHLAIVPEGRCGDTVKILDKGEGTVNKKQLIKLLRDNGVSEGDIALFMKDAKDSDKGNMEEYTRLLVGKDIDMTALIPAITEKIMPKIEELVAGEGFINTLASQIANQMSGQAQDPGMVEEEESLDQDPEEMTPEMMDAKVLKDANIRARLIDVAKPFIKDDSFDIYTATPKEILIKALDSVGVRGDAVKDKSDDYLQGILDSIKKDRVEAETLNLKTIDSSSVESVSEPVSGIGLRQKEKRNKR